MQSFADLLHLHPLIALHLTAALLALHLTAALLALVAGSVVLARPKGTFSHRTLGWAFVGLMAVTALSSVFTRATNLPNIGGFTPIHLLTVVTAVALPQGIWRIRHGQVQAHRRTMTRLFFGACVVAGLFTLWPGRFLGNLLWKQWLGLSI